MSKLSLAAFKAAVRNVLQADGYSGIMLAADPLGRLRVSVRAPDGRQYAAVEQDFTLESVAALRAHLFSLRPQIVASIPQDPQPFLL